MLIVGELLPWRCGFRSRDINAMVAECLAVDPKKRPSIAAILSKPFIKARLPRITSMLSALATPEPQFAPPISIIARLPDAISEDDEDDASDDDDDDMIAAAVGDTPVDVVAESVLSVIAHEGRMHGSHSGGAKPAAAQATPPRNVSR